MTFSSLTVILLHFVDSMSYNASNLDMSTVKLNWARFALLVLAFEVYSLNFKLKTTSKNFSASKCKVKIFSNFFHPPFPVLYSHFTKYFFICFLLTQGLFNRFFIRRWIPLFLLVEVRVQVVKHLDVIRGQPLLDLHKKN